jgi:hypothetical protein
VGDPLDRRDRRAGDPGGDGPHQGSSCGRARAATVLVSGPARGGGRSSDPPRSAARCSPTRGSRPSGSRLRARCARKGRRAPSRPVPRLLLVGVVLAGSSAGGSNVGRTDAARSCRVEPGGCSRRGSRVRSAEDAAVRPDQRGRRAPGAAPAARAVEERRPPVSGGSRRSKRARAEGARTAPRSHRGPVARAGRDRAWVEPERRLRRGGPSR